MRMVALVFVVAACKSKSPPPAPAPAPPPVAAATADARTADAAPADAPRVAPIEPTWFDEVEAFANGRAAVRIGEKWGYIDGKGHVVLPIAYDYIGANAPLTWVRDKAGYHVLAGTRLIATKATNVTPFADGVAMAQTDKRWQLVDGESKPIGTAAFAKANQLGKCALWAVEPVAGAASDDAGAPAAPCVIDKRGQCVAVKKISGQDPFVVGDGAKLGVIDCKGKVIVPFAYDDIKLVDGDRAWVHDGGWGLVDHGKLAIPTKLPVAPKELREREAIVKDPAGKLWLADLGGHVFTPGAWDTIRYLSDGIALVRIDKKWGVMSDDGKMIAEATFQDMGLPSEHRVAFEQDGKWGYLDDHGAVAIAATYGKADHFSDGLAVIRGKDGDGYIDASGNMVLKPTFQLALSANGGMAFAERDDMTYACIVFQQGKPPAVHKSVFWPSSQTWFAHPPASSVESKDGCGYVGPRCTELTKPDDYASCDDFDTAGYAIVNDKAPPPEPVQWDPSMSAAPPEPEPPVQVLELVDAKFTSHATGRNISRIAPGVFEIEDETQEKGGHAGLVANGVQTIPVVYEALEDEHDGFVGVRRDQKWALFRIDGTPLVMERAH